MQKQSFFPAGKSRISQTTIKEIVKLHMTNPKTKMNEEAQQLLTEFTNILVLEAVKRTIKQAISSDLKLVDIEHIEKILPQLMLDFT